MKLFKKLFSVVALCICCVILAAFVGCNTLNEGDGWVEVQSITYTTENGTTTLTSECVWDTTRVNVQKSEYDSAPEELKSFYLPSILSYTDLKEFKQILDDYYVGKTYFYQSSRPNIEGNYIYTKVTVNSYAFKYVKVKIISDKVVKIDFNNEVKQVSTISYEITYFEN